MKIKVCTVCGLRKFKISFYAPISGKRFKICKSCSIERRKKRRALSGNKVVQAPETMELNNVES